MVIIYYGPIIVFYWANATFTAKFVINKFVKRTDIIAINDFLFQMFMMVENTATGICGWFIIYAAFVTSLGQDL